MPWNCTNDALRRSVEKRRTSGLEYQEISEEVGSKGTLTLIGCGMIWVILLIFGLSIWVPAVRWAIVPLLLGYLALLGMSRLRGSIRTLAAERLQALRRERLNASHCCAPRKRRSTVNPRIILERRGHAAHSIGGAG